MMMAKAAADRMFGKLSGADVTDYVTWKEGT